MWLTVSWIFAVVAAFEYEASFIGGTLGRYEKLLAPNF
jgi:hypothetical protein